ncbi:MAG TPA: TolC family protein [Candidatus Acidoferrum sp.]|nr:TolC family protein [Candidatus Acidoferrum sp.]
MTKALARATALLLFPLSALSQQAPPAPPAAAPVSSSAQQTSPAQQTSSVTRISLEEAIRLALQHNHVLQAARSTILQNQALETTANLRPNPVLSWDAQFLPIFQPNQFSADYINNTAQFDLGIGYTFERGKKRQHRLSAARDLTAVSRSQVADNERTLTFNVAQQFISVELAQSSIDLARQDLDSFQKTVEISEQRYKAGDMSEGDFLKIKLQLLQFQTDLSSAQLSKVQAIAALRQLIGFESVPDQFDVQGQLEYQPVHATLQDLKALAMRTRPDLIAAQQSVSAARSQELLAEANGKRDLGASFNYSHTAAVNTGAVFFNIQLPIFDRNQGEIARTRSAITQSQELAQETTEQVMSDVVDAYEALRTNDQIVQLYRSGYVDAAQQSRDISAYAFQKGAASLLDFLDAERTYRANQLAYRQALASYMTALEQTRAAVGTRSLP